MRTPWDAEFWQVIAGLPDPEAPVDPRRARLREIVREAGPAGLGKFHMQELLDPGSLPVSPETVHRWIDSDVQAGLMVWEGTNVRWAGP